MADAKRFAGDLQTGASLILRMGDILLVGLFAVGAYWIWHGNLALPAIYGQGIIAAMLLTANFFHVAHLYEAPNIDRFLYQFGRMSVSWTAVMFTLLALAFITKTTDSFSRAWALIWFPMVLGGLLVLRILLVLQIARWRERGDLRQNIVVIGAGEYGQRLIREMLASDSKSVNIVGLFDRRSSRIPDEVEGVPVRGGIDDLLAYIRQNRVDEIIVALPWRSGGTLLDLVQSLKSAPANVKWCPETIAFLLPVRSLSSIAGVPMINIFERPITGRNLILKMIEDRVGACVLLIALSPLLLAIALLVRLTSAGPALFQQKRYGFNNEEFTVFKFRSMRTEAAQPSNTPDSAVDQATRGDPRVTWVGRILRKSSLDELPQLINVLQGNMSLVGPRPHAVAHNEQFGAVIDEYFARHRVKPGITGWTQVNGLRGETDTPEKMRRRVEFDLHYIDNWSILFDIRILFLTLFVGFVHKNAY
jgi:putative colanic acid biosynthesis UDP-glucose lipid carrier transferase